MWLYRTTGTVRARLSQNRLRNIAAWSWCPCMVVVLALYRSLYPIGVSIVVPGRGILVKRFRGED